MAPKVETGGQTCQKRKGNSTDAGGSRNKRQKTQRDARTLAVQTSSKAFKNGELDVGAFVKAREYEIRALEEGMARARKGLTQRAFQQVPKDLRRRTASHNAKRVPKRLRRQAVREVDNTPTVTSRRRKPSGHMRLRMDTVSRLRKLHFKTKSSDMDGIVSRAPQPKKNKLASPPVPKAKYRKRQLLKTWLPTHMFHAKRAHMTPPAQPLWRFALPLTSTVKSYRPTHRASKDRGAVAWDTSYMSCISIHGNQQSIESLLRALGLGSNDAAWSSRGQKWRSGSRIWQGWLYERDMYPNRPIAPATVIWRAEPIPAPKPSRQVLLRVHPSAFSQLWDQLTQLAKVQKPQLTVEDLRFEIGSIEVVGPASTEALTKEQRQIAFETGAPWFPGDFPGTQAGDEWEVWEGAKRKAQWEAKPKGKRVEWDSLVLAPGEKGEHGEGWACDWALVLEAAAGKGTGDAVSKVHHIAPSLAKSLVLGQTTSTDVLANAISTVRISLLGRGTPDPCARIYRLPTVHGLEKNSLRDQWLALDPARVDSRAQKKKRQRSLPLGILKSSCSTDAQQQLAADLLNPPRSDEHDCCPPLPGGGVAIGSVFVQKLTNHTDGTSHMCIVRNAGETIGRLGKLDFV
ncbi:unnamed protein product [Aureobasidium pullulans]|nr:unnamed protein product [Aureobasidium pullulans]